MIDTYIIQNRKPKLISEVFICNILILILLVVYVINNFTYTFYFSQTSKMRYVDNKFLLVINTQISNIETITKNRKIIINNKEYMYCIEKIEDDIDYNGEYQNIYLKIYNLEDDYLIDNYRVDVKILKGRKKIIDYLKEGVLYD